MKWVARIFFGAVVRRLAVLLVASVLVFLGVGEARAEHYADQGQAYATCLAHRAEAGRRNGWGEDTSQCHITGGGNAYSCFAMNPWLNPVACRHQAGAGGNSADNIYSFSKSCSQRTGDGDGPSRNANAILVGSGSSLCFNGCKYGAPLGDATSRFSLSAGETIRYYNGPSQVPTGEVCSASEGDNPEPLGDYCATVEGLTQCVQQDGRHCAVSSSGKRFCWTPTETGTKTSGNEAATKSPEGMGINPPPTPPKNNGEWQQSGQGTAQITSGGTTNNYTITNHTSNYGTEGKGGGAEGDGAGDGDGEEEGPGGPTEGGIGDIYTPTDKTMESVVQGWWTVMQSTPILGQINMFFGNCSYSGSCPTWTWDSDWTGTVAFTQLCDGTLGDILIYAGYIVMAMGAFAAFRIAIY